MVLLLLKSSTMKRIFVSLLCLTLTIANSVANAAEKAKIELLLDRSPAVANTIGYVDIGSLNRLLSEAGLKPIVSANAKELWFIADLDLGDFSPKWEAGYAVLNQPVEAQKLADAIGGYVDTIDQTEIVHSPQQSYFIPGIEVKERLGILRPANRVLLSKWLNPAVGVNYSSYLLKTAKQPESYLSFMIAIEMTDAFSPIAIAKRLETMESIKSHSPESLAQLIGSIEGVSVIVGRRSLNECIVTFEFEKSPASIEPIAAGLLAEILEKTGNAAPEVLTWKASTSENSLSLQGPITQSTLSGLMGIVSLQNKTELASSIGQSAGRNESERVAYRTKYYFDEVNAIIERTRDHQSQTTGALANWNDKRARQIDELGTLNVDPDMVEYGTNVADLLRGNALDVRQGNIAAGKTKSRQSLGRGYYNGYNYNSVSDYQRVTSATARGNAYASYRGALDEIDTLTAETRRAMTQKHQIQF